MVPATRELARTLFRCRAIGASGGTTRRHQSVQPPISSEIATAAPAAHREPANVDRRRRLSARAGVGCRLQLQRRRFPLVRPVVSIDSPNNCGRLMAASSSARPSSTLPRPRTRLWKRTCHSPLGMSQSTTTTADFLAWPTPARDCRCCGPSFSRRRTRQQRYCGAVDAGAYLRLARSIRYASRRLPGKPDAGSTVWLAPRGRKPARKPLTACAHRAVESAQHGTWNTTRDLHVSNGGVSFAHQTRQKDAEKKRPLCPTQL